MTRITNTTADDPVVKLLVAADPRNIEAQEANGQRELVNSDRLPTEVLYATDADFEALGFTFGPADESDPMFRPATLPPGWQRKGSSHSMWSYIVDERGLERVNIFYKAAFYDRSAHMGLTNVGNGAASNAVYGEDEPSIPWDILTPTEQADARKYLDDMLAKIEQYPDIYGKHADRVNALIATVPPAD